MLESEKSLQLRQAIPLDPVVRLSASWAEAGAWNFYIRLEREQMRLLLRGLAPESDVFCAGADTLDNERLGHAKTPPRSTRHWAAGDRLPIEKMGTGEPLLGF